ncbi:AAA family ATPase [Mycobacterium sp. NPDC003449]
MSGILIGGTPGSGKSAYLGFALAGYAARPDIQLAIVDGRGGHDHDALAPRCWRYIAGDTAHDLLTVRDALRAVQTLMRERISSSLELYGHHNLWSVWPSPQHPAVFLVIDEFQAYMPNQFTAKADKEIAGEITSIVTDVVKRGRSAGVVVFLATQRPTTDSIPSALRDNCGNRICFSVMNRDSAEAVLGTHSAEDDVSPIRQPTGIGVTVVNGGLVRFRAPLVPEHRLAEYVSSFGDLATDPLDLLSSYLAIGANEEDLKNA